MILKFRRLCLESCIETQYSMHMTTQIMKEASVENLKKLHNIKDDVIIASVFYRDMKYSFISSQGKVSTVQYLYKIPKMKKRNSESSLNSTYCKKKFFFIKRILFAIFVLCTV